MGWGVLSLGRGTAQLLKSHGQNWKPVHWPHQRTAQDGCLGLEGRAFTQERTPTHQGSFMNPSSSSPWPDGYCQGLASCPDTMLGKSQPQASGAPGRDVDQRRGGGGGGGKCLTVPLETCPRVFLLPVLWGGEEGVCNVVFVPIRCHHTSWSSAAARRANHSYFSRLMFMFTSLPQQGIAFGCSRF